MKVLRLLAGERVSVCRYGRDPGQLAGFEHGAVRISEPCGPAALQRCRFGGADDAGRDPRPFEAHGGSVELSEE